jgi:hypothetical protein
MRSKSLPGLLIVCAVVLGSLPLRAVDCGSDPPPADCTLRQVYSALYDRAFPGVTTADVATAVVNSNVATTTPDTFAGVVHSTYQDFLNLWSFAINKVDEAKDGQALVVRFNPLREGRNLLGLSLTVSQPVISDLVGKAIPEAGRAAALARLQDQVGDLDDVTYAAAYSAESTTCSWDQASSRCWGRSPAIYRPMLARVLADAADSNLDAVDLTPDEILQFGGLVGADVGSLLKGKLADVKPENRAAVLDFLRKLAARGIQSTLQTKARFAKSGIDKLASLVDNQPQLAATGTYRDPGTYGGPAETGLSLELQFGRDNLNALRRQCPGSTDCVVQALQALAQSGLSTDKFVLTATYKRRDRYTLAKLGLEPPVAGFAPIDLKRTSELHAKLQWGRLLDNQVGARNLRFDLSAEGMETQDDNVRTKSRWVATATLTVPLGNQMSIPVSINYANKPEFLTGQRQQLGAHLGLTYRLPWER